MKKRSKIIVTGIIGAGILALTASIWIPWHKRTEFEKARANLEADLPDYATQILCDLDDVNSVKVTTKFSFKEDTKKYSYNFTDDIIYDIFVDDSLDSLDEFEQYEHLHKIDQTARSLYNNLLYSDSPKYKGYQRKERELDFYNKLVYVDQNVKVFISTDDNFYQCSENSKSYSKNYVSIDLEELQKIRDFEDEYTEVTSSSPWVGIWENSYFEHTQRITKIFSKDNTLYLCAFVDNEQLPFSIVEYPGDSATTIYDFNENGDLILKSYNELLIPAHNSKYDVDGTYTFVRVGSGLEAPGEMTINNKRRKEPSIGMTADEVKLSTWGEPTTINRTTTEYGVSEQWVYGTKGYIYLENGIVTAIQD